MALRVGVRASGWQRVEDVFSVRCDVTDSNHAGKAVLGHATNIEFEKAAQVHDELSKLKERLFGVGGTNVIAIKAA